MRSLGVLDAIIISASAAAMATPDDALSAMRRGCLGCHDRTDSAGGLDLEAIVSGGNLAWRLDLARVATLMFGYQGTGCTYPEIGVADGHHPLTHHAGNEGMIEKVRRINPYQAELFGHFVRGLEAVNEDGRSLLDRSMIVLRAGIADWNRHDHQDLPVLLAGAAGGAWRTGRTLEVPRGTSMCNLYMSMLETIGAGQTRFGDSTGTLGGLG